MRLYTEVTCADCGRATDDWVTYGDQDYCLDCRGVCQNCGRPDRWCDMQGEFCLDCVNWGGV